MPNIPERRAFPARPRSAQEPLWLRNAIWGEKDLMNRFLDSVAETTWIKPGPKRLFVSESFGQGLEWRRVEHWKVEGEKVLFRDGEAIRLQGCNARTLHKLCEWAEHQLGSCFTKERPLEMEYEWCDDGEHFPMGYFWNSSTCTLTEETDPSGRSKAITQPPAPIVIFDRDEAARRPGPYSEGTSTEFIIQATKTSVLEWVDQHVGVHESHPEDAENVFKVSTEGGWTGFRVVEMGKQTWFKIYDTPGRWPSSRHMCCAIASDLNASVLEFGTQIKIMPGDKP